MSGGEEGKDIRAFAEPQTRRPAFVVVLSGGGDGELPGGRGCGSALYTKTLPVECDTGGEPGRGVSEDVCMARGDTLNPAPAAGDRAFVVEIEPTVGGQPGGGECFAEGRVGRGRQPEGDEHAGVGVGRACAPGLEEPVEVVRAVGVVVAEDNGAGHGRCYGRAGARGAG